MVSAPLRSRFGMTARLDYYNADQMQKIIIRSAVCSAWKLTPRVQPRSPRAQRHPENREQSSALGTRLCAGEGEGKITAELADCALAMLEIDRDGFDQWGQAHHRNINSQI